MSATPYYGPTGETPEQIFFERTFMASGYLTALGYGIQLMLYGACVRILWKRQRSHLTIFLICYISVLCAMNTIWTGTSAFGLQATFIDNRNYPGGPYGFLLVEFSLPFNVLSLASYIIGNVLADALLLWRCHVIWKASIGRRADLIVILPAVTLLASLAMGIIYAVDTSSPAGFFGKITVNTGTIFFAISLSLNILLTLMIVVRIWLHQRKHRALLGSTFGRQYTSMSTMFVESAALYAISSILLLTTYSIGNPINQIFLGLSPSVQMIANYLIIYRVAQGRAWTHDTFSSDGLGTGNSPMVFNVRTQTTSRTRTTKTGTSSDADGTEVSMLPLHGLKGSIGDSGSKSDMNEVSREMDKPLGWGAKEAV
ncbi:hypothetical protein BV25DRAFT_1807362 [Artomyces pyxidatus]|uniref:Uncharacterized protein n=1 Tax=Artomyces pyxidatus TaxID=48021 RepID=A0ACB8SX41_9AGAM|nr:hypothetical protein BV25DRAFT_1807362 [Artomyces pyxidatus]